ncbi:MAG: Sir2 silent information regulator family NAD-dependent deacetylase [Clostridiales bacterium]|nr:Sir2 silent information regulator family NAD-dependent deacetylase [Clostridiales bacterium]
MFSRIKTTKSTEIYSVQIDKLKKALDECNAVVIGAGAGLSTAAGFVYNGERFDKYFSDFKAKYGFDDMYYGGFYPYKTQEEFWAYWSRYIYINRYMDVPSDLYIKLFDLVKDKDYFVITTNVDHCFQRAGFDKKRLFYTQGDYGLFQCSEPCCQETFDNEEIIKAMYEQQRDMKISSELLPKCPHCGKPLTTNLRADDKFVQDEGWYKASERYSDFIRRNKDLNILYLELGVGYNTPIIIKYPFWQMTAQNSKATYACINMGEAVCPIEIEHQSIRINADISKVIENIAK